MYEEHIALGLLQSELAYRLQEGQPFDVADRSTQLTQEHVGCFVTHARMDGFFDGIRDVRDDLHGAPEVVAAALLGDHCRVDPARGEVARLGQLGVREPLVVPQIQVRLCAIVGDVDLTVLEGAHGPRIHVDVGVELLHADLQAAALENHSDCGRGEPFAEA